MLKSKSNVLSLSILVAIAFPGCKKEKESHQGAEVKSGVETPAKSKSAPPAAPEAAASNPAFDISLEGYKATNLGEAIHSGSLEKFTSLVQQGAPLDQCLTDDTYVFDALYASIAFGKKDLVEYILKNKLYTDINKAYSEDSETPLTLACALENKADALEISKLLIADGAKVDGVVDSGGEDPKTPLFAAVRQGNVELVRLLVEKGAKKDIVNIIGITPLTAAEEDGFSDIATLLKQ